MQRHLLVVRVRNTKAEPHPDYHRQVAELDTRKRSQLKNSAFAYVDSRGRRRLPIHDESHVRNALSRFNQVIFEDEAARDRARTRLLKAARKYGIVPVGFIEGQLRVQGTSRLPSGAVTFLMTDVVDSTGLLHRLEDRYGPLLTELRRLIRTAVRRSGGVEVDARADEYFAVFKRAPDAISAALEVQRVVGEHEWTDGEVVILRTAVHAGRPTLTESGYVGLAVHAVRRICSSAPGGKVVASHAVLNAIGPRLGAEVTFDELGPHRLKGLPDVEHLFLVRGKS